MKIFLQTGLFIFFTFSARQSFSQYFASTYKPKSKAERLALSKIRALPEVQQWYKTAKRSQPDIEINLPDASQKYYWFQIGVGNFGMFRTNYHLFVAPKTFAIYYNDQMDTSGGKLISLRQWRSWRSKPGFFENHVWKKRKISSFKG